MSNVKPPTGHRAVRCCATCRHNDQNGPMACNLHTEWLAAPWTICDDWDAIPRPEANTKTQENDE